MWSIWPTRTSSRLTRPVWPTVIDDGALPSPSGMFRGRSVASNGVLGPTEPVGTEKEVFALPPEYPTPRPNGRLTPHSVFAPTWTPNGDEDGCGSAKLRSGKLALPWVTVAPEPLLVSVPVTPWATSPSMFSIVGVSWTSSPGQIVSPWFEPGTVTAVESCWIVTAFATPGSIAATARVAMRTRSSAAERGAMGTHRPLTRGPRPRLDQGTRR